MGLKRLLDATHPTCESPVNIDAQNFTIHFTHKSYSIFLSSNSHIMKVQYKDPYEHVTIQPIIQSQHIELATLALLQCLCTLSAYIISIYCQHIQHIASLSSAHHCSTAHGKAVTLKLRMLPCIADIQASTKIRKCFGWVTGMVDVLCLLIPTPDFAFVGIVLFDQTCACRKQRDCR